MFKVIGIKKRFLGRKVEDHQHTYHWVEVMRQNTKGYKALIFGFVPVRVEPYNYRLRLSFIYQGTGFWKLFTFEVSYRGKGILK
ncbi:MAG: hypothetical protein ABIJ08_07290 [Nanoarchaeota archaeon]